LLFRASSAALSSRSSKAKSQSEKTVQGDAQVIVSEKTYRAMPPHLQSLFQKLPNPGSDEVLALFPETGAAKASDIGPGKGKTGCYGVFGGDPGVRGHDDDGGSAARFFYCAKASRDDRDEGCGAFEEKNNMRVNAPRLSEEDKVSSLSRNPHPTVKPTDLMRYLCRLITPPGGIVLDPFTGSGSTGKAAMAEGFRFIGIEREAEYIEIARARISAEADKPRQLSLF
jgi:site-specific DNA-methyltransferase (adenine-specific)